MSPLKIFWQFSTQEIWPQNKFHFLRCNITFDSSSKDIAHARSILQITRIERKYMGVARIFQRGGGGGAGYTESYIN